MLQKVIEAGIRSTLSVGHAVALEPVQSGHIRILRGPTSLICGSGAVDGVVHVVNDHKPGVNTHDFHARTAARAIAYSRHQRRDLIGADFVTACPARGGYNAFPASALA